MELDFRSIAEQALAITAARPRVQRSLDLIEYMKLHGGIISCAEIVDPSWLKHSCVLMNQIAIALPRLKLRTFGSLYEILQFIIEIRDSGSQLRHIIESREEFMLARLGCVWSVLLAEQNYDAAFDRWDHFSKSLDKANSLKSLLVNIKRNASQLAELYEDTGMFRDAILLEYSNRIELVNEHADKITRKKQEERDRYMQWLANAVNEEYERTEHTGPRYQKYLTTPEWAKTRQKKHQQAMWTCEECGYKGSLSVHHNFYKRLPGEWDRDLEVLCDSCHAKRHGRLVSSK